MLFHLFLYNRYWLSEFSIFVVQLWNKNRFFIPFFTGNTFKELFAKVRKIFDTQCSFDDLISTLDGRLSGCPLCPIHPEFITSFNRDTPRLIFEWPGLRKDLRIFENGVEVIRLSGCITPKQADKLSRVDMFRLVASGLDRLHRCARMGAMVIGGMVMVGIRDWGLCTRWEGWGKVGLFDYP